MILCLIYLLIHCSLVWSRVHILFGNLLGVCAVNVFAMIQPYYLIIVPLFYNPLASQQDIRPLLSSGPPIDPDNTREYIPEWFSSIATLSQCTHNGRSYNDEHNDFRLEIPEGAIPEGESITIDIDV